MTNDDTDSGATGWISSKLPTVGADTRVLLVFLLLIAGTVGAGIAAADLADETVTVNNDTESVFLEVTNTSGDNVNYTVYGVDDGITTQVDSGQISAAANDTTRQEFAVDTDTYGQYRIVVEEDASDTDNESVGAIEIGKTVSQPASSGGGLFGSASGLLTPLNLFIAVLVVAAAFLLGLFDPIKERVMSSG